MKDLMWIIDYSVEVYDGLTVERMGEHYDLNIDFVDKFDFKYNTNNGVCVFCYRGDCFVTQNKPEVIDALKEAGFEQELFYVPLSNDEIPVASEEYAQYRKTFKEEWK